MANKKSDRQKERENLYDLSMAMAKLAKEVTSAVAVLDKAQKGYENGKAKIIKDVIKVLTPVFIIFIAFFLMKFMECDSYFSILGFEVHAQPCVCGAK